MKCADKVRLHRRTLGETDLLAQNRVPDETGTTRVGFRV